MEEEEKQKKIKQILPVVKLSWGMKWTGTKIRNLQLDEWLKKWTCSSFNHKKL